MKTGDRLVDDLADAILDGTPIDWAAAASALDTILGELRRASTKRSSGVISGFSSRSAAARRETSSAPGTLGSIAKSR